MRDDDADGAADDGQRAGAEADLGQQPQDLPPVAAERARGPGERPDVERELVAEVRRGALERLLRRPTLRSVRPSSSTLFGGTTWK